MDTSLLERKFEDMGAKVTVADRPPRRSRRSWFTGQPARRFTIDVRNGRKGEFFEVVVGKEAEDDVEVSVIDLRPRDRHLLLMVKDSGAPGAKGKTGTKSKFLCGHDERHWFVAAVPESARASTVWEAKEALKPGVVREAQDREQVKHRDRQRRRNPGFVRQGEWFFLPRPKFHPPEAEILRNEPIRARGKAHWVEFLYRTGGEQVYVNERFPNGIVEAQLRALVRRQPELRNLPWRRMVRDPKVYAKGKVSHSDHATVVLPCWHLVAMNTENQSEAGRQVVFLD
jgi:hypothetical protein